MVLAVNISVKKQHNKSQPAPIYSNSRVINNSSQIKNIEEIVIGARYYQVNLRSSGEISNHDVKITSVDFEREKYTAKHYCCFDKTFVICELEHSLADFGVLPYNWSGSVYHEKWNTRNWLVLKD